MDDRFEETQSEGPEGDSVGLGRNVSRLHGEDRLYQTHRRAHAQVRPDILAETTEKRAVTSPTKSCDTLLLGNFSQL